MDQQLQPVKDNNGHFNGFYKCSGCETQFKKHPTTPDAMRVEFVHHVLTFHPKATNSESTNK